MKLATLAPVPRVSLALRSVYGRGAGVGRSLGGGVGRIVSGVAVAVAVGVGVGLPAGTTATAASSSSPPTLLLGVESGSN